MKDNLKGVSSSFIIIDNIRTQILKIDGPNAEAKYSTTVHAAIDRVQSCVSPASFKAALVILWLMHMSLIIVSDQCSSTSLFGISNKAHLGSLLDLLVLISGMTVPVDHSLCIHEFHSARSFFHLHVQSDIRLA